jgi:hypothetical protein
MRPRTKVRGKQLQLIMSGLAIAGSIVGAWFVIESSKTTEEYLVTLQDFATGSPIRPENVQKAELSLFGLSDSYLKSGDLQEGTYLTRPISKGEAIPRAAITTQYLDDWSNLVLTPSVELSSAISPGATVSVWASPALDFQTFGEPVIAAVDAEVVEIREPKDNFAQAAKSVELRVPREAIQGLLRSIANGDAIALTAFGGSRSG